jgi:hypothetical protein
VTTWVYANEVAVLRAWRLNGNLDATMPGGGRERDVVKLHGHHVILKQTTTHTTMSSMVAFRLGTKSVSSAVSMMPPIRTAHLRPEFAAIELSLPRYACPRPHYLTSVAVSLHASLRPEWHPRARCNGRKSLSAGLRYPSLAGQLALKHVARDNQHRVPQQVWRAAKVAQSFDDDRLHLGEPQGARA